MTYRLKRDATIEAIWNALPQHISEQLTVALAAACEDPYGTTEPHGVDDGLVRELVLDRLIVILYLGHHDKVVHVWQINYWG